MLIKKKAGLRGWPTSESGKDCPSSRSQGWDPGQVDLATEPEGRGDARGWWVVRNPGDDNIAHHQHLAGMDV